MKKTKFRIWDKQQQKMLDWEHILDSPDLQEFLLFADKEDNLYSPLMQYTGLKDVEQFDEPKKLYEGDIVSMHQFLFDGEEFESEIKGVLTYNEGLAAVCLTNIQHHDIRKYMGYGTDKAEFEKEEIPVCNFYGLHETSWTYLGNIYENPELFKGGN